MSEMRPIPTCPGFYATADGRIFGPRPRFHLDMVELNQYPNSQGYRRVYLPRDGEPARDQKVHRLVLEAFVGECPPGMLARHLDGNKANNHLSNLAWGTPKENAADSIAHGTQPTGERVGTCRFSDDEVAHALARIANGESGRSVARSIGVSKTQISRWRRGQSRAAIGGAASPALDPADGLKEGVRA